MSKLKAIKLLGEIIEEVTGWLTLRQWFCLLVALGLLVAILVPVLVS